MVPKNGIYSRYCIGLCSQFENGFPPQSYSLTVKLVNLYGMFKTREYWKCILVEPVPSAHGLKKIVASFKGVTRILILYDVLARKNS